MPIVWLHSSLAAVSCFYSSSIIMSTHYIQGEGSASVHRPIIRWKCFLYCHIVLSFVSCPSWQRELEARSGQVGS
uniref:Secreted protein n=1 Tax=Rhizophora mucronata TaxID=61149 RepID=A0A2P2MYT6_RHIMU